MLIRSTYLKRLCYYIAPITLLFSLYAAGKQSPQADTNKITKHGTANIRFLTRDRGFVPKDSVLIIFDRWNRSGPGTVYRVFHLDKDNQITIGDLPTGSYYVSIQCLGMHHDRFETTTRIHRKKKQTLTLRLADCEAFSKDKTSIPKDVIDPVRLAIFRK